MTRTLVLSCALAAAMPPAVLARTAVPESASRAFDDYIRTVEERLRSAGPVLRLDERGGCAAGPDRRSDPRCLAPEAARRVAQGEVVVVRDPGGEAAARSFPGALCHRWVGTVLVPRAPLDRVLALMQDYERYPQTYAPAVRRARIRSHDRTRYRVDLQLAMTKVITVVLDTANDVVYTRLSPTRAQVASATARVDEVRDAGTAAERLVPRDDARGYLWRFNNYCTLEETSLGTVVQCETVSLSRDVPFGLGWLIGPFVTSVPRESLEFTLRAMRRALSTQPG